MPRPLNLALKQTLKIMVYNTEHYTLFRTDIIKVRIPCCQCHGDSARVFARYGTIRINYPIYKQTSTD